MKAHRLKQIETIYHQILAVSPADRESILAESCGDDIELRREVESLLSFKNSSDDLLSASPESLAAEMLADEKWDNFIGQEIGHYKIQKLLGKGGMGEVYLAEDIKLARRVALKLLPPEFVENEERMSRFVREAKLASALNHPNIITIYEIDEFEGIHCIATEYVDGKTLTEYAKIRSLNIESVLGIAMQIASALEEAHSADIIHRDIKPDNVMIRPNGLVKVLDFGIAKLVEERHREGETGREGERARGSEDKTLVTSSLPPDVTPSLKTEPGMIIGTPIYMSPEQKEGRSIDRRTDIFSFGVVLYEMVTGKIPREGVTTSGTIDTILSGEASKIPAGLEKIVGKCLRKNKNERYQTINEALTDLQDLKRELALPNGSQQIHFSTESTGSNTQEVQTKTAGSLRQTSEEMVSRKRSFNKFTAIALAILLVSLSGIFGYQYFVADKKIESIAVMPFVNESGDREVQYLSDGMTENLISSLSSIPNLSVKARSTVFTYKGREKSAKAIGKELNVDAVLFGRLLQKGEEIKLRLELVNTASEDILWSKNYDRPIKRLVSLQSEIARNVSGHLRLQLTSAEKKQVAKSYTTNSDAKQMYLRGRFHWNKRNIKDFEKAVVYFKQAVEKDPDYALAYAGLADTYALMPLYGSFRPTEYMPKAKQSARKALELDKDLAEAHAALGRILNSYDYDWEGAQREYRRSIELNPNYATARQWYAESLAFRGKTEEALEEISKALKLDPLSLAVNRMRSIVLGVAGRHNEAIAHLRKTEELYPENAFVKYNLGDAYAAKGSFSKAVEQYLLALEVEGQNPEEIQKFAGAYKKNGWKGFWLEYLKVLLEQRKTLLEKEENAYIKNESIAYAYAATGNRAATLEYLYQAYEERDPDLITIKTSGVYKFLNDDPQFKKFIKKIGLPGVMQN